MEEIKVGQYTEREMIRFLDLTGEGACVLNEVSKAEGERKPPEGPLVRMLSQLLPDIGRDDGFLDILLLVGKRDGLYGEVRDDEISAPLNGRPFPDLLPEVLLRSFRDYGHSDPRSPNKALYIDLDGNVYGVRKRLIAPPTFILNGTGEEILEMGDSLAPKHAYAAYMSTRGLSAAYLHGETGKVLTFLNGRVARDLSF